MEDKLDKKEIAISIVRSAFSAIPYAGQLFNEVFFEYRGRLKQERLNKFTELLSQYFSKNQNFNIESFQSEDFSDLLESILKRVVDTKSEQKLERFKDILINSLNENIDYENSERYLDLVKSLSEIEIKILKSHLPLDAVFDEKYDKQIITENSLKVLNSNVDRERDIRDKGFANNYELAVSELNAAENLIRVIDEQNKQVGKYRLSTFYNIEESEFLYYKQKLFSLGLLIDLGAGRMDYKPFKEMSITEFAKKFIDYIKQ